MGAVYMDTGKACEDLVFNDADSPLSMGELSPHLTQCGLGQGLPAHQVAS